MRFEIEWSEEAEADFGQLIDYLESEWGSRVTESLILRVEKIIDHLSTHPNLGKRLHVGKNIRAYLITPQTYLYYQLDHNKIILLSFLQTRRKVD